MLERTKKMFKENMKDCDEGLMKDKDQGKNVNN